MKSHRRNALGKALRRALRRSNFKIKHSTSTSLSCKDMSSDLAAVLSEHDSKRLYTTLWSWTLCQSCEAGRNCGDAETPNCPSQRLRRLARFLQYYSEQCAIYCDAVDSYSERILKEHTDLWRIIERLRQNPDVTKIDLANTMENVVAHAAYPENNQNRTCRKDQELAIDLAVRIMTMVNCYSQPRGISFLEQGLHKVPWNHDVPFAKYAACLFARSVDAQIKPETSDVSGINNLPETSDIPEEVRSKLTAAKLKKGLGLIFRPTNDLVSHLKFDRETNILEIFQQTAALKEHLYLTKHVPDLSIAESLKL